MSNEKLKRENYYLLGGINSKTSPYTTSQMPLEFLDLGNVDFQFPNDLTARWGSTQYFGQTLPGQINSLFEFSYLNGSSFIGFGWSGGIAYGATTGTNQGVSLTLQSATFVSRYAFTFYGPPASSTQSPIELPAPGFAPPYLGILGQNIYFATFAQSPLVQSDNTLSTAMLNNFLFAADGNKFFKFDGTTTYPVGLPPATRAIHGYTVVSGLTEVVSASMFYSNLSNDIGFGFGYTAGTGGTFSLWGQYFIYCSYVNNRGFEGPIWPLMAAPLIFWPAGASVSGLGGTYLNVRMPIATPLQYGISAINVYTYYNPLIETGQSNAIFGQTGLTPNLDTSIWETYPYVLTGSQASSGSTITWVSLGSSVGGQTYMTGNIGPSPDSITQSYFPLGFSATIANNNVTNISWANYYPSIVDTYLNRLMLAGFSATPSVVWFSDAGEPEGYEPDFNFEVRTNDGDAITAMKSYQTRFLIFKLKSFHLMIGDDPSNFDVVQVSDQFGCVNKKCVVVGGENDEMVFFLDPKGMVVWNGASPQMVSRKIQPTFDTMNLAAAKTQACMVHDKIRNQIICAIPVNGSSTNNLMVVYDYLANAWTKYSGVFPSVLAAAFGYNNQKYALYGDYLGRVNYFGPSFLSDNGVGFSTYIKPGFNHDMGDSIQKQFRRLYLNVDVPSSTMVFGVNFFQDYGSSVVLGTTMILSQFQNRIDFGISAKSVTFEMSNLQTSQRLRIHGFTIESRLQRRV